MKIIVADDHEDSRFMLSKVLTSDGHDVTAVSNGVEALRAARQAPADIIISDILMPEMDGFTLFREVKRDRQLRRIPFIFYTATYTDPKDEELALGLGGSRYIVKPVETDTFLSIIHEVVQECKEEKLHVPRMPLKDQAELSGMYDEVLARKLDEKVHELDARNVQLQESAEREVRSALYLSHVSDSIIVINSEAVVTFANEEFSRLWEYAPAEVIGKP